MGRWLSPDWSAAPAPVPYADLSDPQSLNLYGYVRNRPTLRADADGHCDWCNRSLEYFSEEVSGLRSTTTKAVVALAHSIASGEAKHNIGTTLSLAVHNPAAIGAALKEGANNVGQVISDASKGEPNAIGKMAGVGILVGAGFADGANSQTGMLRGTNESGQLTSRSSLRTGTVQNTWDNAADGANGGKLCPTCGGEVGGNPGAGEARGGQWDVHHDPPWTQRQFSPDTTRPQVIDNFQEGTGLRCVACNRSDNRPPSQD